MFTTGQQFTIAGVYRRRTWWERLLRRPRVLQMFTVGEPYIHRGHQAEMARRGVAQ